MPLSDDRDVVIVRLPRPHWPWRKLPIRTLGEFVRMVSKGDRAAYWRVLFGGRRWALLLVTQGREGDLPPRERAQAVRLNPKWAARLREQREGAPDSEEGTDER